MKSPPEAQTERPEEIPEWLRPRPRRSPLADLYQPPKPEREILEESVKAATAFVRSLPLRQRGPGTQLAASPPRARTKPQP